MERQRWEYMQEPLIHKRNNDFAAILARLGDEGWELCGFAGIFRRVLTILGVLCSCRNTSRAFRGPHGRDYVRCLDCGRQHDSAIQFGCIDESWRKR